MKVLQAVKTAPLWDKKTCRIGDCCCCPSSRARWKPCVVFGAYPVTVK